MPVKKANANAKSNNDFARSLISNVSLESEIIFAPSEKHIRAVENALARLKLNGNWDDRLLRKLTLKISDRIKETPLDAVYHAFLEIPIMTMATTPGQRGGQMASPRLK